MTDRCCLCSETATMYLQYKNLGNRHGFEDIYCFKDGSKKMIELGFLLHKTEVKEKKRRNSIKGQVRSSARTNSSE